MAHAARSRVPIGLLVHLLVHRLKQVLAHTPSCSSEVTRPFDPLSASLCGRGKGRGSYVSYGTEPVMEQATELSKVF